MVKFTRVEERFLQDNEIAKLATVGPDLIPHVVPVCYVYTAGTFWVATDYETRKFRNLKRNRGIALLVDVGAYSNHGILIQGRAEFIEKGQAFSKIYRVFFKRFDWVRAEPWKEGEAPFLRIKPLRKVSWGM